MIRDSEQKLVQIAGSSIAVPAFVAFVPGLMYEFLQMSLSSWRPAIPMPETVSWAGEGWRGA
jgi:hypothetical protein